MPNTPEVDNFIAMAIQLTQAAVAYAGGPSDPEMNSMLRQVQVAISALQSALNTVAMQSGRT